MGIFSSSYNVLSDEIYPKVPEVSCDACGACCVSPHMTLIEFCYLMRYLLGKPDLFVQTLSRIVPHHPAYPDHLICRFQTPDNLCLVYPHRVLACRLHGHPVLEKAGLQYHVHCKMTKQFDSSFSTGDINALMDHLSRLNQGYYSYYTPPYWISGLNTETWLTIMFTEIPQNVFRLLKKLMIRELGLQDMSGHFFQNVMINEKLALIDMFQTLLSSGCFENLGPILEKIQNDFPDTGAYYYFESDMYRKTLEERKGRLYKQGQQA